VNLPKNLEIGSALPIQEINYGCDNILAQTFPFRHTVGPYCLCEFSHLEKAKRIEGKGNRFFTQKLHVHLANSHRSPQSQTNTQPMPAF
jgi:hypothetical protein